MLGRNGPFKCKCYFIFDNAQLVCVQLRTSRICCCTFCNFCTFCCNLLPSSVFLSNSPKTQLKPHPQQMLRPSHFFVFCSVFFSFYPFVAIIWIINFSQFLYWALCGSKTSKNVLPLFLLYFFVILNHSQFCFTKSKQRCCSVHPTFFPIFVANILYVYLYTVFCIVFISVQQGFIFGCTILWA